MNLLVGLALPGSAEAATVSEDAKGIRYSGGGDANDVRIVPASPESLVFEERNEEVVIDDQAASCVVTSSLSRSTVECEDVPEKLKVDAGAHGDTIATGSTRDACVATGIILRVNGGSGSDIITGDAANDILSGGLLRRLGFTAVGATTIFAETTATTRSSGVGATTRFVVMFGEDALLAGPGKDEGKRR